jgi:hypothetical protein
MAGGILHLSAVSALSAVKKPGPEILAAGPGGSTRAGSPRNFSPQPLQPHDKCSAPPRESPPQVPSQTGWPPRANRPKVPRMTESPTVTSVP